MSYPILYVQDKSKFYDTKRGGALISLEMAKSRLISYSPKLADPAAMSEAIKHIMDFPVEHDDVRQSKEGPSLTQLWAGLMPLIKLRKQLNGAGQEQIFYVADNNEVTKVEYIDEQSLINAMMHRPEDFAAVREFHSAAGCKMTLLPFLKKMLAEFWQADERMLCAYEPQQISWDTDTLAYKQMDPDLLVGGPTPTWDEFTSRLDYPNVFMAWVWSIFDPDNNIRQVLWLKGAGNDGKSSIQKAIETVIGRNYCYAMKPGDEQQQWFQRNVFSKVLVNYADCRNQFLIDSNSIKQLTGGDTTSIEGKGENSFTGKIYAKLLVTSNFAPRINPDSQAHTSRLIKLEVAPQDDAKKDAGFELRLQDEIYAFLTKCKLYYDELISHGGDRLILPEQLVEQIKVECASETYLNIQDFVESHIKFGAEEVCEPSKLRKASKDYFLLDKQISTAQLKHHEAELVAKLYANGCAQFRINDVDGRLTTTWKGFMLLK